MVSKELEKIVESHAMIAQSMRGIKDSLDAINDHNILHAQREETRHVEMNAKSEKILDTLKTMTDKYWWLIIVLIGILAAVAGYKQVLQAIFV